MASELVKRIAVGWTREQLAMASGVSVAAVYLFERMGTAGVDDDARIRNALAEAGSECARGNVIILGNQRRHPDVT